MGSASDTVDVMLAEWAGELPELDTSGMGVVLRVQFLAGLFAERLKEILAPAGLAPWEYEVLSALRRADASGGLTPGELCRFAQLTSGAMTHRLDRLEERALVRRREAPEDRRSVRVELTRKGRALVDGIVGERMEDAARSLAALGRRERRELERLLRVVAADLEAGDASEDAAGP